MRQLLLATGLVLLLGMSILNQAEIYKLHHEMQVLHVEVKDAYARL